MPQIKHKLVGEVSYSVRDDKTIQLHGDWARKNIVTVHVPALKGVDIGGNRKFDGNVRWYKGGIYQLKSAFAEVEAKGLKSKILTYAGSFYPRLIRGASYTPSEHTFGTAFDINVAWNGLNRTPAPKGTKGSVYELVPIFEKWGFRWGGNFRRKDGMHFELARLIQPQSDRTVASKTAAPVDYPMLKIGSTILQGASLGPRGWSGDISEAFEAAGVKYSVKRTGNDYEITIL